MRERQRLDIRQISRIEIPKTKKAENNEIIIMTVVSKKDAFNNFINSKIEKTKDWAHGM